MESLGRKSREKRRMFFDLWTKESKKIYKFRKYKQSKKKIGLRNAISSRPKRKLSGKFGNLCQALESFS
jgi:hypothetical protein